jgi:hypothetical protein
MSDDKNLYMCAIYIPPDKNVFYREYECDIFDVLQEEIELLGCFKSSVNQSITKYIVRNIFYKICNIII